MEIVHILPTFHRYIDEARVDMMQNILPQEPLSLIYNTNNQKHLFSCLTMAGEEIHFCLYPPLFLPDLNKQHN